MRALIRLLTAGLIGLLALLLAACPEVSTGGQPSFGLELGETAITTVPGASANVSVTIAASNGFAAAVDLDLSGDLSDLTFAFADNPVTDATTLTLTVDSGASFGTRTLTVSGSGGGVTAETDLEFEVADPATVTGGVESHAPGRKGVETTAVIDGETITYTVIDGLAIYQGDMILGDADEVAAELAAAAERGGLRRNATGCAIDLLFICGRWADGVVPYSIRNDWGVNNGEMNRRINQAIAHWEANTSLRFVLQSGGERVEFRNNPGGGCSAAIGRSIRIFEAQGVNLSIDCGMGVVIHEIGHAIGLFHEQGRDDRDSHVTIQWENIRDGRGIEFVKDLILGLDIGDYDFDSIMHYGPAGFARDARACAGGDLSKCTIVTNDLANLGRIGQRSGLSDGDILAAYVLYPPRFEVAGATAGEVSDLFGLTVRFDTVAPPASFFEWTSNRVAGVLGTGYFLSLRAADVPAGVHTITARAVFLGVTLAEATLQIEVANAAPTVDLGPDRDVDLNREVFVTATASDAEDGDCPVSVCTFSWDPPNTSGGGGTVGYLFTSAGPQTITVTVEDKGGATASDSVVLNVVNSPPTAVIDVPTPGASFSSGSSLLLSGSATDPNEGPGPLPGLLACSALSWTSSDASDLFSGGGIGCSPTVTFGNAGLRTLTLTASDPQGLDGTATVQVNVTACSSNCNPDVTFVIPTPLDEPTGNPDYYLNTTIEMNATINDADVPPDNPIAYLWVADPPCFNPGGCGADEIILAQGNATDPSGATPATVDIFWTPEDDITPWSNCTSVPLPYVIRLTVTDARGGVNTFTRTIDLACEFF